MHGMAVGSRAHLEKISIASREWYRTVLMRGAVCCHFVCVLCAPHVASFYVWILIILRVNDYCNSNLYGFTSVCVLFFNGCFYVDNLKVCCIFISTFLFFAM